MKYPRKAGVRAMGVPSRAWGNNLRWYKCFCGKVVHGRAFWRHKYACPKVPDGMKPVEYRKGGKYYKKDEGSK